ncbi:iron-sulfur cluster assembly accessory protein [Aliifodinibius salipaludis]|uniref:Iron-sulfur cluster assembly accessory protein n=1 Tax=Fodinibius salipaludis TaxID=2032627 RepID=A0A2A2G859_9BACT|nr:iron-sulfur cluster assembly accessory protein [Aliifodinibius salipaludis]PAU93801.1 iron-sulfur cluster assembly accessory protein [Aliifodinibius salipaludis]
MSISITDRAAQRIKQIREDQEISDDALLRVGVVSGGCSGLTYDLEFDSNPQNGDEEIQQFEDKGINLVVDMRSFLYLSGTELDYTDGLNGEGFHFHNPNANRTCSCGESFSI